MKIVVCVVIILAGIGIGYSAPRPEPMDNTIAFRPIRSSVSATTAAARSTQRYDTAQLTAVRSIQYGPVSCIDGEVSFNDPTPAFTLTNGYGGMNISYVYETQGGTIEDLFGAVESTEHGYGAYRVSSQSIDTSTTYLASRSSGGKWHYAADSEQLYYRVHVTSPVDITSEWYALPQVSSSRCSVSTR